MADEEKSLKVVCGTDDDFVKSEWLAAIKAGYNVEHTACAADGWVPCREIRYDHTMAPLAGSRWRFRIREKGENSHEE